MQNVGNINSNIEIAFTGNAKFLSACCCFRYETIYQTLHLQLGEKNRKNIIIISKVTAITTNQGSDQVQNLHTYFQAYISISCLHKNPPDMDLLELILFTVLVRLSLPVIQ